MPTSNHKKPRSVFRTIMVPLMVLLIAETGLLAAVLAGSRVFQQLNRNSENIVQKQVENRAGYLASSFSTWTDLNQIINEVNARTQALLDDGTLSLDTFESDSAGLSALILDLTDDLISTLYSKRLNGIYLMFNTQDLTELAVGETPGNKTGIYIRDMDPTSAPSSRYADLLLARAPISVVQNLYISTDSYWQPQYSFKAANDSSYYSYLTQPLYAAFSAEKINSVTELGCWTHSTLPLYNASFSATFYSVPLVLEDGTIYGVLGIEILDSYLRSLLPYPELLDGNSGAYLLSMDTLNPSLPKDMELHTYLSSSAGIAPQSIKLEARGNGYNCTINDQNYFVSAVTLPLHANRLGDTWTLTGMVPTSALYAFANLLFLLLLLDLILMALTGIFGSILIGRRLAVPIRRLSREVDEAQRAASGIPSLSSTGIEEIDLFSSAITTLSHDVVHTSTRFLNIIHLASIELGGFELRPESNSVYVTDNLLPMLGIHDVPASTLTVTRFIQIREELTRYYFSVNEADGSHLYKIPGEDGHDRYIRVQVTYLENFEVGVAEDITIATLERLRTEHERDYDLLTGLINRRAFFAQAENLFATPGLLKHAALIMIDMDDLKGINDTWGHDNGDRFIRHAGQTFEKITPTNTICSRISGDEFNLFFYGYSDYEALNDELMRLSKALEALTFLVPDGKEIPIHASAGVAIYPEDANDFQTLMKYADFAMYQVKHQHHLGRFDLGLGRFDLNAFRQSSGKNTSN